MKSLRSSLIVAFGAFVGATLSPNPYPPVLVGVWAFIGTAVVEVLVGMYFKGRGEPK